MSAVLSALRRAGVQTMEGGQDCDAALIWSVLWSGRMAANQTVYEHYRSQNKPVVIIDIGALHRGHTWKVAINHVNALGYYGHQHDLGSAPAKSAMARSTYHGSLDRTADF